MSGLLESLEMHPIRIPMRHRFRRVDHRDAVLIRGPEGWGEFSPFPGYPPEVTNRWLASALESACTPLPEPGRSPITVNVTIPAVDAPTAAGLVAESGASTAKVKVGEPGESLADEVDRIASVRGALGPDGMIRIDANGAWSVDEAEKHLEALSQFGLEYVEQPVSTIEEMIELRGRTDVPLAADELVRSARDPLEVAASGALDVLVVKVQPMGGVGRTLDLARRSGMAVVVSSALETSVGIYPGLLAASLLEDTGLASGLGTVSLLDGDVTSHPLIPTRGELEVRRPEPSRDLLERWHPDPDESAAMLRRVRAAAEVLT